MQQKSLSICRHHCCCFSDNIHNKLLPLWLLPSTVGYIINMPMDNAY